MFEISLLDAILKSPRELRENAVNWEEATWCQLYKKHNLHQGGNLMQEILRENSSYRRELWQALCFLSLYFSLYKTPEEGWKYGSAIKNTD